MRFFIGQAGSEIDLRTGLISRELFSKYRKVYHLVILYLYFFGMKQAEPPEDGDSRFTLFGRHAFGLIQ